MIFTQGGPDSSTLSFTIWICLTSNFPSGEFLLRLVTSLTLSLSKKKKKKKRKEKKTERDWTLDHPVRKYRDAHG